MGQVAGLDVTDLVSILGKAAGRHLHALAHNRDPRPVQTGRRRRSIGSQRALGRSPHDLDAILASLIDGTTRRLRTAHRACRTVVLRLRFADFTRATRSHTLIHPTADTSLLLSAARRLLTDTTQEITDRGITLLGVSLANLSDEDTIQLMLPFDNHSPGALDATLDRLKDRFGTSSVTRAALLGHDTGISVPLLPDQNPDGPA